MKNYSQFAILLSEIDKLFNYIEKNSVSRNVYC